MAVCRITAFVLLTIFADVTLGQGTCTVNSGCLYTNVAIRPTTNTQPSTHYYLGGLFGVHERAPDSYSCSESAIRDRGIINLEAFMWAIGKYSPLNSNVSIGGVALDSCSRPEQTIENILSFETCKVSLGGVTPRNLLAYIGPDTSSDAMSSAMMLKDMNKTQISHAATSPELSNLDPYPFFLRTVPSDVYDLNIVASLLSLLNSKYALVVYTGSTYGRDGFAAFKTAAKDKNICIVYSAELPAQPTAAQFDNLTKSLVERGLVRFLVVIATATDARTILNGINTQSSVALANFVVLGTSSWTKSVVDNLDVTAYHASLGVPAVPNFAADTNEFYAYLDNLKVTQNSWNGKWFREYRDSKYGCTAFQPCSDDKTLAGKYQKDPFVPYTLAAVKAAINGISDGSRAFCKTTDLCSTFLNLDNRGQKIYDGIVNAQAGSTRFFNNDGDASYAFTSFNVMKVDGRSNSASTSGMIGTFTPSRGLIIINHTLPVITSSCPNSPCRECGELPPSTSTQAPRTTTPEPNPSTVDPTAGGDFVSVRFLQNYTFTGAYDASSISRDLQSIYAAGLKDFIKYGTRFAIGQNWIIALGVLAGLGILSVIVFEVYILYKLLGTRIGRQWRTMWLGQLLLFGIFLSYLTLFAYLPIPTNETCGITRFGVGFCYSVMFAVLLVKLMVILTSKSSSEALIAGDIESPNYLKGIYQFLMFLFAVGVQVVINVQWLIQVPPYAIHVTTYTGKKEWICNHYTWEAKKGWDDLRTFIRTPFENHLLSLIYIMALILMTTIVAMKAHGIITNHRESVFIGIGAGFSIPVWIAWGLVGGLNKDDDHAQEYGDASMAFGLFVTATLCLFAMFLPKVRQLVNMGVEGIYLEDDRDTYYAGSVVMGPPSYKSRPSSMVYVNQGEYSNPVVIGNGDPNHLKHQGSMYSGHSAPVYTKRSDYGSSKVLKVTGDLTGKHPTERRRPVSEVAYGGYAGSYRKTRSESGGTLRKARSTQDLGAL